MGKRLTKSEQESFAHEKSLSAALLKMQQVFDRHQQDNVEKLFTILRTVAADTRNASIMALDKCHEAHKIPDTYKQNFKFRYVLERRYFVIGEPDVPLPQCHDNFVGVGFDSFKGRVFVCIDGRRIYEPSAHGDSLDMSIYITNVVEAIEKFEKLKEEAIYFFKDINDAIEAYEADKSLFLKLKSQLSQHERDAIARLIVTI